ncbi:hypothetical protein CXF83_02845 [Shewanella sp. Choline-02u-19]|jgi:hypothetical protein|uniref:hypothetical protein n=1 Tax=unclassified Shewanella TaxID=196818 RepID=UPI000C33736E|nr:MULTISPECIES: hypothetical protein [unclassified Shewanella]PKG56107.1 hypothetical protein CXF82_16485 [Shewanella sp. GutDb-MelDb]PKH57279.1 hypothetical protein CXF84_09910 [Shewanella sp. Bg11-22]PKI29607.1 hypothetical protein CXF83_02845 [Shewanella sp. Choline-02u-19]
MSEQVGPISIEQWQQFEKALAFHARAEDWEKLVIVNEKMCNALKKAGKPHSRSQVLARQSLAQSHAKIVQQLRQAQGKIKQEMAQFEQQQDGLAAYQFTCASAGVTND